MIRRERSQFSLRRLEGLTDGIYAIAMTLLVLSLPLPQLGGTSTNNDILEHFSEITELFGTYALSFILLANFWIIQLKIFKYIKMSCTPHLWANLGGLLVVCLIPFSSSLVGCHNHTFTANLFFHFNIFLISVFFLIQCRVLLINPETIADQFDESAIRRVIRINLILPVVSLIGIGIAFFAPDWSILVYIAVPFLTNQLKVRISNPQKEESNGL
ncbi:MAG: TMEM175 family protein [Candidatus Sabulitectum sp.]|nr:TMEM175 family protein [Candidatus Sabulitectum sp.]